ncbi:HRDC domain-containing protein [Salisediminibacterium beveridgei]|uniref:HRDC domain protein n=1 Tax=Salisediminibacterium beveridgei TaxID=632773 RepID=A0A1D7QRK6_9BACI|nr:HRDC domain-containing protein [Salisediminibacterium beveridgei]AOM81632.1 HRDC domain protein [Salisediminibacterium beveridgei]
MAFLKNVYHALSNTRDMKEPEVYKAFQEKSPVITELTRLKESGDPAIDQKKVEDHLKLFTIGHAGEKSVFFELQNAMLPMVILHDVYIQYKGYEAQLDFVIITHKFILVLEVKKMFGNIHVTEKGDFQRVITNKNRIVNKEGIYSPVNQVERHVGILQNLLTDEGIIKRFPVKYAVTFANSKTILTMAKKAPKKIQQCVIRHDQIKPFIKRELEQDSPSFLLDKEVYRIADAVLKFSAEKPFNREPYQRKGSPAPTDLPEENEVLSEEKTHLKTALLAFRHERATEVNTNPALIIPDDVLHQLVKKKPVTIKELAAVQGIDFEQVEQFGADITGIIQTAVDTRLSPPSTDEAIQEDPVHKASRDQTRDQRIDTLRNALMSFRTTRAKELNAKAYYIFTNKTMEAILLKAPKTMEELLEVEGIGPKKAEEFGQEILAIVRESRGS